MQTILSVLLLVMLAKYDSRAHFGPAIKQWGQVGGGGRWGGGVAIEVGMSGSIIGLALSVISGKALFCNSLSNSVMIQLHPCRSVHTHTHTCMEINNGTVGDILSLSHLMRSACCPLTNIV